MATARARSAFAEFVRHEALGALVLLACSVIALVWANGPWSWAYFDFGRLPLGFGFLGVGIELPLHLWVNDGLMAVFFLVVGLEIKREMTSGELSSARSAALPGVAALGGLAAPAAIFALVNAGGPGARGWGVPIATDIAFSLAVLALLGRRVPVELKIFLTALAIVDDIGALAVIAIFYTAALDLTALAWAGLSFLVMTAIGRIGVRRLWPFALGGLVLWLLLLKSGVHATIAGVLTAFCIPAFAKDSESTPSPLERAEHALLPWTTYLVIPLFGLLNAGVSFGGSPLQAMAQPVGLGVLLGLVVGKPVGVMAATWIAVRLGAAQLPASVTWIHLAGAACLAGIGFTMSIFVSELAFAGTPMLDTAKVGVLVASVIAAGLGWAFLRTAPEPNRT